MAELRNEILVAVVSVALTVPATLFLNQVRDEHAVSAKRVSNLKEFRDVVNLLNSDIRSPDYEAFERDIPKLREETDTGRYRELVPDDHRDSDTLVSITDAASQEAGNYLTCIKDSRSGSARQVCRDTAYGYLMPTFNALSDVVNDIASRHARN